MGILTLSIAVKHCCSAFVAIYLSEEEDPKLRPMDSMLCWRQLAESKERKMAQEQKTE